MLNVMERPSTFAATNVGKSSCPRPQVPSRGAAVAGKNDNRTVSTSLSLIGAVALGTGVMIGAGIFALTGQMAEMTGSLFPLAFLSAALIVSFSADSYVKLGAASGNGLQST